MSYPKPVYSSHLNLRFYKRNGWTADILRKYVSTGDIMDSEELGDAPESAYLSISLGSKVDIESLSLEISAIRRYYPGVPQETDMEYLKSMLS